MPAASEQPTPRPRTRWPMALWTAGILLFLGLVWIAARTVVIHSQVRAALDVFGGRRYREATDLLGGPSQAAEKLSLYLRLPGAVAPEKNDALLLLALCDEPGMTAMIGVLANRDPILRRDACTFLIADQDLGRRLPGISADPVVAVPALVRGLADSDDQVRSWAALALGTHGAGARSAVPTLEQALRDRSGEVRKRAAEALAGIRAGEPAE